MDIFKINLSEYENVDYKKIMEEKLQEYRKILKDQD